MRRLKGKMLALLCVLLTTVCVSAFAGLRDEAWTVNPSDFRYDMSLYFKMANSDFEDLSSYEIGAFVGDDCRGLAEKLELSQNESCLYMRIRSNVAQGEKLTFYMKDRKTGQIVLVKGDDGSELTFKADTRIGMPSDPFLMSPYYTAVFKIDGEFMQTMELGYGDPVVAPQAPAKEGYTFNGWGDVPATMPAYDIELYGSYSVNKYKLTFMVGEDELFSGEVAYGAAIVAPEVPSKEGYSFSGWTDLPETMPAKDLVFNGEYEVMSFNVVYKIDGETVHTDKVAYGQAIPEFKDVPAKTGYSFSGWLEIPDSMPARDVEINGFYTINHYTVTFYVGDDVFVSQELAYEEEIIKPEAPAKEGYSFTGWENVPSAMPAENLVFKGDYTVNTYSVVFRIDQEVFSTLELEYGAEIVAPEAPDMEGHTFSGWGEVPATMPAYDLVFVGTYADNYYTITFKVGDEVIKMADLAYGAEILLPEVPEKEGYSFSGWGNVPAAMPAANIEIVGSYILNNYSITFKIDEEVIYAGQLAYGAEVSAPQAPDKEGYTFSGWGIVPAVMPASDLVISGTYNVNTYTLTFLVDGEIIYSFPVPFGSEIALPEPPEKEGYSLVGWTAPQATMPAYDLNINGTYNVNMYMVTFKIDDEIVFGGFVPYGGEITVPEAPVKEGYTFAGWGMVPGVMPASNLEFNGSYDVNIYNLTFMVDGESVYSASVPYGAEIVAPFLPDKEGNTFSGWGDMPKTMPANDLVLSGTYSLNYYMLTFKVGEDVIFSGEVPYGASIEAPQAPAKEGHTFVSWGDVPAVMPAGNLEFVGEYVTNSYSLTFKIGDEVISEENILFGDPVRIPNVQDKEGYSFTGWGVVPEVMPAQDLVITGSYEANNYSVTFKIGEEVIYYALLPYGSAIVAPEVPEKEGHTFAGWGEIPAVVPAENLEFSGSYTVNTYTVTFTIGDEVVAKSEVAYGDMIILPVVLDKEGYTFSGWGIIPTSMPASDLNFCGNYEINYYTLTFKLNDEVIYSSLVAYGSEIVAPEIKVEEDYEFSGWSEYPATMPAGDVEVTGTLTDKRGAVDSITGETDTVTVVTPDGVVLFMNVKVSEIEGKLASGLYIINGKKVMVKQ
ncbi:MAG: InlB B-repeat-containing protein [Muribaculaceae bacterium]|nr:InlB B-repeat-containing protein [Muribaculaceae bacterium]